ncbi:hypothetical protein [Lachnobacterium bovis]|uniref:SHOCT domain-containing protein n=1 Tax=Lachnobacterium bovis TaxID=140626 RepID=A0A1H9PGN3_9FIRM|nr:hypothetical protein [Lachnobacterium bovis]SER47314.1 hypothetical protein SAMN02910429_00256 [Lachnobacterium bovis]
MNLLEKIALSAKDVGTTVCTTVKEHGEFANIKLKQLAAERELNELYQKIGKRYVDFVRNGELIETFDVEDLLDEIDPIIDKYETFKREYSKQQAYVRDVYDEKERIKAKREYEKAKEHLAKALEMGILSRDEYEEKIERAKSKVDYFDEIRKIKMQRMLGLITKSEYDEKIKKVLDRNKQKETNDDI